MTVLRIFKFILKLLMFLVFLPVLVLLVLFKLWRYRTVLERNMILSGMPKEYAKQLGKETKLRKLMSWRSLK
jgi:dolichyl-phosphate-mannose--protein O-mannosyl transferase